MTTIKRLTIKPVKKLGKPVFSFKRTQEAAQKNIKTLAAFNGNLVAEIEYQKGSPLEYGSEFWGINGIKDDSVITNTKRVYSTQSKKGRATTYH